MSQEECVEVPIEDDQIIEGNENFMLSVSSLESRITIQPNTSTIIIVDNEQNCKLYAIELHTVHVIWEFFVYG